MIRIVRSIFFVGLFVALFLRPPTAPAQVTTGSITGRVVDSTGGVIPNAQVVLISETHNSKGAPIKTDSSGNYVFPDVTADTYTVEVSAASFKTTRATGIVVTGGDRIGVPAITLQVGATTESVTVTDQAALLQTQSGERSYSIDNTQIQDLPIAHGNFTAAVAFTPGVNGTSRLGSPQDENNIQMDGVSAMDTGNNGQMLSLNIESIGDVKVITQGFQAEYGRSSGMQITAVTKSGSNSFHGSGYGIFTNTNWNSRPWTNQKNGTGLVESHANTYGYTIGGPVIIPKIYNGRNKLFFFYAHEFRPSSTIINSANPVQLRVPTALELAGNFSQSLDNNGKLIAPIVDNTTGQPFAGGIIPGSRIYAPGFAVINRYPAANLTQAPGTAFNYQEQPGSYNQLLQQPVVRMDYNVTSKIRLTGDYSEQIQRAVVQPGTIPGYNDSYSPYPYIIHWASTVDWTVTPSMVFEATWGSIENQLAGGGSPGALLSDPAANKDTALSAFPSLYPNWGILNTGYYAYQVLQAQGKSAPEYNAATNQLNMVPTFGFGSLIGDAPPNLTFPSYLNINHTDDYVASLTKIWGRHTIKGGAYVNHSYKAQNTGAGGLANLNPQGYVDFGNNTTNALDSGFGYANAELGVFNQYLQQSKYVEASMLSYNTEFYIEDNWKVNNRLTLDYGLRFVHQTPQYDEFDQESNFFTTGQTNGFSGANAQVLYTAGCSNGAAVCSGNTRNALNPLTGAIVSAAGAANTQALIGTPVPGIGNPLNGIVQAGHGIANTNYLQPGLVLGPRFGFAYDVTGKSDWVIRGGGGLFYDRPDGNTVFSTPGNAPIATDQNLFDGQLQSLGTGLSPLPVPSLVTMQYNAPIPSTFEWNVGVQKQLPLQMVGDISYVGNHAYNRYGGTQGGTQQLQNQVPLGTAYEAAYQDPTLGTSTVPGNTAYTTNLLRPYPGLSTIGQNLPAFYDTYHSIQISLTRRFNHGFSFGANYTYGISLKGNTGLVQRDVLSAPYTLTARSDEAAYEALNATLDPIPNFLKINTTWAPTGVGSSFVHALTTDWQISGVWTYNSGSDYTPNYSYQTAGSNVNITGSPDFAGNDYLNMGSLGSGCSANQFEQFNPAAVTGPTYGSVEMESPRNPLRYCATNDVDTSFVRRFRFWKFKEARSFQFRADVFNTLNAVMINNRQGQAQFNNPTSMTLVNSEFATGGAIASGKSLPQNAGFGAATGAQTMRNLQLEVRVTF